MAQLNDSETGETIVIRVDRDLEDLIPGFINNRRKDAESIADALKRKDYETIRVLGHGMKGAGGGYGFDAITDFGKIIESAARNKDAGEISKQISDMMIYLDKVKVVYESD